MPVFINKTESRQTVLSGRCESLQGSFVNGHVQDGCKHGQHNSGVPDRIVGTKVVVEITAESDTDKAAHLVGEKNNTHQRGHVAHTKDLRDDAHGQRYR